VAADLGLGLEVAQLAELRQVVVPGACLRAGDVLRRVAARRLGRAPRRGAVEVAPHLGLHARRLLRRKVRVAARRPRRRHGERLLGSPARVSALARSKGQRGLVNGDSVADQTVVGLCSLYGRATRGFRPFRAGVGDGLFCGGDPGRLRRRRSRDGGVWSDCERWDGGWIRLSRWGSAASVPKLVTADGDGRMVPDFARCRPALLLSFLHFAEHAW
jgi:hypothetical protein